MIVTCSQEKINLSKEISYRDVVLVANCDTYEILIDPSIIEKVLRVREKFLEYIDRGECYGVTTGLGAQVETKIPREDLSEIYRIMLKQHAAGVGDYLPKELVRGAMIVLAKQLSLGYSATSPEIINTLVEMINKNITPLVPRYGSLGASGDLAPMSYIALAIYGEGSVIDDRGLVRSSKEVLEQKNIRIPKIDVKDPLSLINNTAMSLSIASHVLYMADKLLASLIIASTISLEAMASPLEPFSKSINEAKKQSGVILVSKIIRELLRDSSINRSVILQDRYSFRTIPQVLGSFYDVLRFSRHIINTELNSSTDNPIFDGEKCVSGGNFYGIYITSAVESLSTPLFQALAQSERRVFSMLDPKLNRGLPPFLTKGPDTGYMISQYTMVSLLNRISSLLYPSSIFTAPTSASQEDHVSNSYNSSLKMLEALDLGMYIVSIEYLVGSRALILRDKIDYASTSVRRFVKEIENLVEKDLWDYELGELINKARGKLENLVENELRNKPLNEILH
ncbi:MAG: aromatic amino acid ammonia-lyase [Sulfolobales archaeon]